MEDLKHWQWKIADRRKQNSFEDFLREVVSWVSINFYKNNGLLSKYPSSDRINVIALKQFQENRDKNIDYGLEYNPDQSFFELFQTLMRKVPQATLIHFWNNENSEFSDTVVESRNCYMSWSITIDTDTALYCFWVRIHSKNIFNSVFVATHSENIYFTRCILSSSHIFYSAFLNNCNNIWFSSNLTGCSECISCNNLLNATYCINNKKYTKEEYFEKKEEILKEKQRFLSYYIGCEKKWNNYNSTNVSGSFISDSENIENGIFTYSTRNGKNLIFSWSPEWCEEMYDYFGGGSYGTHHSYGVAISWGNNHVYCGVSIWYSSNIYYCYDMTHCSYCIGCVWLQNKKYCILNKQYSKQDWYILADKIFSQMEQEEVLWDFFPWDINPFYFNDTVASLYQDFDKDDIIQRWYLWRDEEIKVDIPEGSEVIQTWDLNKYQWFSPDGEWKINPEILNKVIVDEKWNYYRIVKTEYDFLMKHSLPLPELHWMDRMKLNFWV